MNKALWIIAVCEIIRTIQNSIQLAYVNRNDKRSDNALQEFITHLKMSDKEFVKDMLEELVNEDWDNEDCL